MLPRAVTAELSSRLAASPAVALIGPRQCGKTTLARALGREYFDLEQDADRLRLDLQWDDLVAGGELVILDEAQAAPDVFARLRGTIDADRKRMGRFLLLGSVSPSLMTQVSESLAGRLSLVELTPLLWSELPSDAARRRHWLMGGYPDGGILEPKRFPRWQTDYLALLSQRDLPAWGLPAKPQVTDRLLRMLAALHGQTRNASKIGESLGVSYQTINSYLEYLVGAFLIRRLQPYQGNVAKRLVKSPKLYWRDTGLLHAILNVPDDHSLLGQPWVGASWEGYVIEQVLGALSARGALVHPYFFRTSDRIECDLLLELAGELVAIEIKLTSSPSPADMAALEKAADLVGATRRYLVSRVASAAGDERSASCNLAGVLERVTALVR